MKKQNLSDKLRGLRSAKGYTQDYMAHKLQITQKTYSSWENGASELPIAKLKRICEILDVCTEKLRKEEEPAANPQVLETIYELRKDINLILQKLGLDGGSAPPPLNSIMLRLTRVKSILY